MVPQIAHHQFLRLFRDRPLRVNPVQQILRPDIGSHNQDRILEIHRPPLGIRDPAVVQHLQKHVEYIGMCLLDLIKEHNRIGLSSDCLRQLAALLITHISGRRSDQPGDRILLHIFAHVDTDHVRLVVKQRSRQRLCQFRLSYAGRTEEQERTDRLCGILDSRLGTNNSICYLCHALVLSDYPLMQFLVQMQRLVPLALRQL